MISYLKLSNNSFARMRSFFVTITILSVCYSPLVESVCNSEVINARRVTRRIANEWPLRPSQDNKTRYVQKIANSIVHTIETRMRSHYFNWPLEPWKFLLVRDLSVNAYSIGNGQVYLTDGTYDFVKTEAELAAIIAHELAHQLKGHFCQNDEQHSEYRVGSLVQVLNNKKEIEADALAIKILQKTKFPPQAMFEIVKRLPASMQDDVLKQLRIKALKHQLQGIKKISFSSSPEFLLLKQN